MENPLRYEAAALLRKIADLVGCETQFQAGSTPSQLVQSVAYKHSEPKFLLEAFRLLSRLVNKQNLRVPLIDSSDFLINLVRSFSNSFLRDSAINLAANIAMDPSMRGKSALLDADVLSAIGPYLSDPDKEVRFSVISLLALLGVPKDGKIMITAEPNIPKIIVDIIQNDPDESCKKAANEVRICVSELPDGENLFAKLLGETSEK